MTDESFIIGKDQEPIELLLGLGFLLFVLVNKFRYRRGAAAPSFALRVGLSERRLQRRVTSCGGRGGEP